MVIVHCYVLFWFEYGTKIIIFRIFQGLGSKKDFDKKFIKLISFRRGFLGWDLFGWLGCVFSFGSSTANVAKQYGVTYQFDFSNRTGVCIPYEECELK